MRRPALLLTAIAVAVTACRDEPTSPGNAPAPGIARSASRSLEGWLHALWGDPRAGAGPALLEYVLMDDRGHPTGLVLDSALAKRSGGPRALDRKRARIRGDEIARGRVMVRSIEILQPAGAEPALAVLGSHPYITIGCKFSDISSEPRTIATYRTWTSGSTYPGLNHYWLEQSYNKMDVAGSQVVGWYTLPFPREHYVPGGSADLWSLLTDCTGLADPDVDFPSYYGINLQFNEYLDCCSWGGYAARSARRRTAPSDELSEPRL